MADEGHRPSKKVKFSEALVSVSELLVQPAKDAITFHLLLGATRQELAAEMETGGLPFCGEYFNQVFGEAEEIKGYRGLAVDVWIAASSGHAWASVSCEERRPDADDVLALLREWWPAAGLVATKDDFLAAVDAARADWDSLGEPLSRVPAAQGELALFHGRLSEMPQWFKELHARLEPLLVFAIDGASLIDKDDDSWEIIAAVLHHHATGRQFMVGWCSLYNFWHMGGPHSSRPRVAQVLVLPPLQGSGFGKALVAAAYSLARSRDASDLTFEDASPGLQLLRESLELEALAGCPWVVEAAQRALAAAEAAELRCQEAARALWQQAECVRHEQAAQAAAELPAAAPAAQLPAAGVDGASNGAAALDARVAAAAKAAAAGGGGGGTGEAPASLLALPPDVARRVVAELKLHKNQVGRCWESVLFLLSPLGSAEEAEAGADADQPLHEPLVELVMSRLEGSAAAADRYAARKRLVQVAGTEDWFVYKRRDRAAGAEEPSDTIMLGTRHNITQVTPDEQNERIAQAAAARMQQLRLLKARALARKAAAPA